MLHRSGVEAELLVAGDGPLRQDITDRAGALGLKLHLLGFCNQSQMPAAYAAADVLALPSNGKETWGLVANEALACGTPVVVADSVGCAPDLAELFGDRIISACGRVDSLIDRLQAVLHCPPSAESMAAANRKFSLSAAADGVVSALNSLTEFAVDGDNRG
jgi:glycosyltransferase involved in cell wall biosynthesis